MKNSQYPPLLQRESWTRLVPFKEQKYHRTPSESIANVFTPTAADLKINKLKQPTRKPPARSITGPIRSSKTVARLTGELKDITSTTDVGVPPDRPKSPSLQINESLSFPEEPNEYDLERFDYYVQNEINKKDLLELDPNCFLKMVSLADKEAASRYQASKIATQKMISNTDLKHSSRPTTPEHWIHTAKDTSKETITDDIVADLEAEISQDFEQSQRKAIVSYILEDPEERKRIKIQTIPKFHQANHQSPCAMA